MTGLANLLAQFWWDWMGSMLWQASLLILIVSVVDLLIAKWAWPQLRYALWLLILLKLLIPPSWHLPSSVVSEMRPWAQERIAQMWGLEIPGAGADRTAGAASPERPVAASPQLLPGLSRDASPAEAPPRLQWQAYALAVWLTGMIAFASLLLRRIVQLRRWHRQQQERRTIPVWFHELMVQTAEKLELARLPAIVFSRDAVTPAVYGLFRPVLLLPASYTDSLSREEAEHVLLHELAHLKRGDLWLHGLSLLLQIVYWFNPLMLWVTRQMKHVRELCCDLTVANFLRDRTMMYRRTLLNTARRLLTESVEPGMGLLGVFEEPFRLVARLRWLEKESWRGRRRMAATVMLVIAFMVPCVLPMAAAAPAGPEELREGSVAGTVPASRSGPGEETYVLEKTWRRSYFLGIPTGTELSAVTELWIGDGRCALIAEGRTVLLDLETNLVTFINHRDRTYLEAAHPLDIRRYLSEGGGRHPLSPTSAEVVETGRSATCLGLECREYTVHTWEVEPGYRRNPRTFTVWASVEPPVDPTPFHELISDVRAFYNRDRRALEELAKVEGIQLRTSLLSGPVWSRRAMETEVVEIASRVPPPGLHSVPDGYTRRTAFRKSDF